MKPAAPLQFTLVPRPRDVPGEGVREAYLISDNWDDWGKFSTLYQLRVFDERGTAHKIGGVKIGSFGLRPSGVAGETGARRAAVPNQFTALDESFFSLGQTNSYYEKLSKLEPTMRVEITIALRDVVADEKLWERAKNEEVMADSLLREVSRKTVEGQYRRILAGGARLTRYSFSYSPTEIHSTESSPLTLRFVVRPESLPPTNIHVIIGSNGVGKTRLLHSMVRSFIHEGAANLGTFVFDEGNTKETFSGVVSVSFSAFDDFEILDKGPPGAPDSDYYYIGLKTWSPPPRRSDRPKSPSALASEFSESIPVCMHGPRLLRWRRALAMLEADPLFRELDIARVLQDAQPRQDAQIADGPPNTAAPVRPSDRLREAARGLFESLSSGHKIVLLTIARLVEKVEEKTLVLLDEPESHLHPPLLSAFTRALSELLIDRNGVAVIATHSPVILQEVPRCCVWKLYRSGEYVKAERPEIETFGENVGILIREVFGLQVDRAGFHRMLNNISRSHGTYEAALSEFDEQLGSEARGILRGMYLTKNRPASDA